MKVKVIKNAFYNLEYIKAGQVIDFKGDKLPSWATLASGIETKKGKEPDTPKTPKEPEKKEEVKTPEINPDADNAENNTPVIEAETDTKETNTADAANAAQGETEKNALNDVEKQQYLELLLNESIEKNVLIEDADKKTVDEQIAELEKALKKEEE